MIDAIMKKKNILFILFIIIGMPFLCFILLIAGGLWLYFSTVKTADEQPRQKTPTVQNNVEILH